MFLLGAFVVGGILLIGYRAIANLGEQQCRAQEIEFARKIESAFNNGLSRGVVRVHEFSLPCGATELCLVERSTIDARGGNTDNIDLRYAIISNSIDNGEPASVWVRDEGGYTKIDSITRALPVADFGTGPEGLRCFMGTDLVLRFEGRGQSVYVTEDR